MNITKLITNSIVIVGISLTALAELANAQGVGRPKPSSNRAIETDDNTTPNRLLQDSSESHDKLPGNELFRGRPGRSIPGR